MMMMMMMMMMTVNMYGRNVQWNIKEKCIEFTCCVCVD